MDQENGLGRVSQRFFKRPSVEGEGVEDGLMFGSSRAGTAMAHEEGIIVHAPEQEGPTKVQGIDHFSHQYIADLMGLHDPGEMRRQVLQQCPTVCLSSVQHPVDEPPSQVRKGRKGRADDNGY